MNTYATLPELMEHLMEKDQLELIELLSITSEEIVNRFDDRIEDLYDKLVEETDDSDEDEED